MIHVHHKSPITARAFTVAVGSPYSEVAIASQECVRENTGLETTVLGEDSFRASGLDHPAALRLQMFDIFEEEVLFYFDADWICLSRWDPLKDGASRALIACRDFIYAGECPDDIYDFDSEYFLGTKDGRALEHKGPLREQYIDEIREFAQLQTSPSMWINSGLMIVNRTNHRDLFNHAARLYKTRLGCHPKYYEQPSIQRAIAESGTEVRLLPRCYNVLANREHTWPTSVTGLHIKTKAHPRFLKYLSEKGDLITTNDIKLFFCPS